MGDNGGGAVDDNYDDSVDDDDDGVEDNGNGVDDDVPEEKPHALPLLPPWAARVARVGPPRSCNYP